jgi:hypothetical protein
MANLRGGSYQKQAKDGFHRVEAFGVKRHGSDDHLTHSDAIAAKRDMFFRDIVAFAEENKFSAKLNVLMGNQTVMDKFFNNRIKDLSSGTAENYLRGFSSLIEGLREKNVTIDDTISKDYFDKKVAYAKVILKDNETRMDRAIYNPQQVIKDLYEKSFSSGVVAEVLNQLGIRISEAYELISNYQKYYKDGSVEGLVGKGNHIYLAKTISTALLNKIQKVEKLQEQNTFRNHLKAVTEGEHKPHDFRFTFANQLFNKKLAAGVEYKTAMREVSKELNHSRAEMTNYYLSRA